MEEDRPEEEPATVDDKKKRKKAEPAADLKWDIRKYVAEEKDLPWDAMKLDHDRTHGQVLQTSVLLWLLVGAVL